MQVVGQQNFAMGAVVGMVLLVPAVVAFVIDRIMLTLNATVPGIDESTFQDIAHAAKRDCPLSKALASVAEITLVATREQGSHP